jgi:hypothetical protein
MKQITDAERIAATLTLGLKSTVDADGRVTVYDDHVSCITRDHSCWISDISDYVYPSTYVTDCPDWRKSMVGGE